MPNRWQVQDAKARFSELLETSLSDGPQIAAVAIVRRLTVATRNARDFQPFGVQTLDPWAGNA